MVFPLFATARGALRFFFRSPRPAPAIVGCALLTLDPYACSLSRSPLPALFSRSKSSEPQAGSGKMGKVADKSVARTAYRPPALRSRPAPPSSSFFRPPFLLLVLAPALCAPGSNLSRSPLPASRSRLSVPRFTVFSAHRSPLPAPCSPLSAHPAYPNLRVPGLRFFPLTAPRSLLSAHPAYPNLPPLRFWFSLILHPSSLIPALCSAHPAYPNLPPLSALCSPLSQLLGALRLPQPTSQSGCSAGVAAASRRRRLRA
jgi:hypothetical protein